MKTERRRFSREHDSRPAIRATIRDLEADLASGALDESHEWAARIMRNAWRATLAGLERKWAPDDALRAAAGEPVSG